MEAMDVVFFIFLILYLDSSAFQEADFVIIYLKKLIFKIWHTLSETSNIY